MSQEKLGTAAEKTPAINSMVQSMEGVTNKSAADLGGSPSKISLQGGDATPKKTSDGAKSKMSLKEKMLAKATGGMGSQSILGSMQGSQVNGMGSLGAMAAQHQQQMQIASMGQAFNNMPGRPQYQMADISALGIGMNDKPTEKHVLSTNAAVLREELVGYVDAILERQDRGDVLKKMETFQIESASRKTFRELTEHYKKLDQDNKEKAQKIQQLADMTKKRVDQQDTQVKKLQSAVQEINVLNKKLQQMEQKVDQTNINNVKKFESINEKIQSTKVYLETKIDAINMLEDKFAQNKEDVKKVQDIFLRTKTEMLQMITDVKHDFSKYSQRHDTHEARMDQVIGDCKYWMDKYSKAYKENDKLITTNRAEFNGRIDTILYQLNRRVTNDDIRKNFQAWNDMLFIKFKQLEDVKTGLRDMMAYQKYFYPLQMQVVIGENMQHLEVAQKDQSFVQFQQRKYDETMIELEKQLRLAKPEIDEELREHYNLLDKHELKASGWISEPLDNTDHDYVSPLLFNYLDDLKQRQEAGNSENATFIETMRKVVKMDMMRDVVNHQYEKIGGLKKSADEQEKELESERKAAEHARKVNILITKRVEFKKDKAFKRQNSYGPKLEDFGDIDDHDRIKTGLTRVRQSIKHKRELHNIVVKDCVVHRLEKDILAASETQASQMGLPARGSARPAPNFQQTQNSMMNKQQMMSGGGMIGDAQQLQVPMMNQSLPQIVKTPDGQEAYQNLDGSTSPIVTQPNGEKMVQNRDGTLTPLSSLTPAGGVQAQGLSPAGTAQNFNQAGAAQTIIQQVMVPAGPAELDPADRRKLIKEVKEEVKPLISQIADYQIEKANGVIKTQLRKIENEMAHENDKLHDRIAREIQATKELAALNLRLVEKEIKDQIRDNAKQRARDKADNDIRHGKNEEKLTITDMKLQEHSVSFSSLAVVTSMLIENINMQMEAEMADLLDRRMMSLFGVSPTKVDKVEVQNHSKKLRQARGGFMGSKSPEPRHDESFMYDNSLPQIDSKRGSATFGANHDEDAIATLTDGPAELKATVQSKNSNTQILNSDAQNSELAQLDKEYLMAEKKLEQTGRLPISIDNKCLMSMQGNRDTSIVLRLFKTACLSYAPSEINYRQLKMSRHILLGLRRQLIDKVTQYMSNSGLFQEGSIYPRRYFDDLIVEQNLAAQQSHREKLDATSMSMDQQSLGEMLNSKVPFGLPQQRSVGQGYFTKGSIGNILPHQMSSPNMASDDTGLGSGLSTSINLMPQVQGLNRDSAYKKSSRFNPNNASPNSSRNFAGQDFTLDTDSAHGSKLTMAQQKMINANTTRNLRNRTIDLPHAQSSAETTMKSNRVDLNQNLHTPRLGKMNNNFGRIAGAKKISLPQKSARNLGENSEAQLAGLDHGNVDINLPKIH